MRNDPALQRVLQYADDNNLTWAQVEAATWAQIALIAFPPSGVIPVGYKAYTWAAFGRCLKGIYIERQRAARRQQVIDWLAAQGVVVDEIDVQGDGWFRVHIQDDE